MSLQIYKLSRAYYDYFIVGDTNNNCFSTYGSDDFNNALYLTKNDGLMRWQDILKKFPDYSERHNNTEWYSLDEVQKAFDDYHESKKE